MLAALSFSDWLYRAAQTRWGSPAIRFLYKRPVRAALVSFISRIALRQYCSKPIPFSLLYSHAQDLQVGCSVFWLSRSHFGRSLARSEHLLTPGPSEYLVFVDDRALILVDRCRPRPLKSPKKISAQFVDDEADESCVYSPAAPTCLTQCMLVSEDGVLVDSQPDAGDGGASDAGDLRDNPESEE